MAVAQGGIPEGIGEEMDRRHVIGVLHAILHGVMTDEHHSRSIIHVELGDAGERLIVRVDGLGGAWLLNLEKLP